VQPRIPTSAGLAQLLDQAPRNRAGLAAVEVLHCGETTGMAESNPSSSIPKLRHSHRATITAMNA